MASRTQSWILCTQCETKRRLILSLSSCFHGEEQVARMNSNRSGPTGCCHVVTQSSGPLCGLPGDVQNFFKHRKLSHPCDVLGCNRLCVCSVSGRVVAFYAKRSAGCQAPFYSPTAVKGRDGGRMQCHTSLFVVDDLNCTEKSLKIKFFS